MIIYDAMNKAQLFILSIFHNAVLIDISFAETGNDITSFYLCYIIKWSVYSNVFLV